MEDDGIWISHVTEACAEVAYRRSTDSSKSWSFPDTIFGTAVHQGTLFMKTAAQQLACSNTHHDTATMTQVISQSGHDDMIHDAVLDYYGRRLATCSSDKTIKIFEIEGDQHRLTETLKGYVPRTPRNLPSQCI